MTSEAAADTVVDAPGRAVKRHAGESTLGQNGLFNMERGECVGDTTFSLT